MILAMFFCIIRVDPSAELENEIHTPMEMAVLYHWDEPELLKILAEFKEIPDDVKILQLWMLIRKGSGGDGDVKKMTGGDDNFENLKEQFQKILHTVTSVETVSHFQSSQPKYLGEHQRRELRNPPAIGCDGQHARFGSPSVGIWVCQISKPLVSICIT